MMKLETSPKLATLAKVLFYGGIVVVTALLANKLENLNPFVKETPQHTAEELVKDEGFNFKALLEDEEAGGGLKVGERIDFSALRSRDDRTMSDALLEREFSMLVVVDPICQSCARATGYMQKVRDEIVKRGGAYYVVTFARQQQPPALLDYTDSLNLNVRGFAWHHAKAAHPASLDKILVPAHILVDKNQTVRGVWPGASPNPAISDKMATQIRNDLDKLIAQN